MPHNAYDALPYLSQSYADTQPHHLAGLAALRGLAPPPPDTCRVLELGCGDGTNLLAIAQGLPGARCYGLDASARHIETGRRRAAQLGLSNLRLERRDILEFPADAGEFDYIIVHGVYSWVAAPVQDKILAICAAHLAPQGVAYVSYNTRPGWNMRGTTRDMLLYHTRQFEDIPTRVEQLHALLDFLQAALPGRDTPYHAHLRDEIGFFRELSDNYLFHEFLEEHNRPLYFYQFMDQAARHGLHYLGDARPPVTFRGFVLPEELRPPDGELGPLHAEQYLDFLENRQFRQTLLGRREVDLSPRIMPERLESFAFASDLRPLAAQPDLAGPGAESFDNRAATINEDRPLVKAALWHLSRAWPGSLAFPEVYRRARAAARTADSPAARRELAAALGEFYRGELLSASPAPPRCAGVLGARPLASPLARLQQAEGLASVSNLRGQQIKLNAIALHLLPYLDGRHSVAQLAEVVAGWIAAGRLTPPADIARDGQVPPAYLEQQVRGLLGKFLDSGLLLE